MYQITLTAAEYRDADFMAARGYLGELTRHATTTEWADDEETVVLTFRESDAWQVNDACDADHDAVWALTTPRTSLGEKFLAFLNAIV